MYFLIGGGGKIGEMVARLLLGGGHEVALLERDAERAQLLAHALSGRVMVLQGNACDEGSLREAGCEHADVFCALAGQDDTNLAACELARTLFKVPRCVARVNDARNERIFTKLDIAVVSSTVVIARMIEKEALSAGTRNVMTLKHGEFALVEVEIPNSSSLRASGGQRVSELDLPPDTVLVSVSNVEKFETVNGRTILEPGDTVLVCVSSEYEDDARRVLLNL